MKLKLVLLIPALVFALLSAVWAESFYVANLGINTITKYDRDGNGSLFTESFINGPTGIALDASGRVYVSTKDNTIEKFTADGTALGVFVSQGLSNPMGLAFNADGHLFVANFDSDTVKEFSAEGKDLGVFAKVTQPTGLAFDVGGNLYVGSYTNVIRRFSPSGKSLATFQSSGLNHPQGLAFNSLGVLYVANNGSNTVRTFSPDGVDLGIAPESFANPAPTPAEDNLARHVYINYRTDGVAGNGTKASPFDGSTQAKLDAVFKSYYDAGETNLTFHLGPGTFQMKGAWDFEWAMLTGWHIKGAGRDLTIVQQVVGAAGVLPGSNGALFSNGQALTYDNQSVEDLTCDCAWFRSGPGGDNSRPQFPGDQSLRVKSHHSQRFRKRLRLAGQ